MSYTPPTELHAIGLDALRRYEAGGDALSEADCAHLRAELEALYGQLEPLLDAVHSLGALMLHAERQGRTEAAARLTAVIRHTKPYFQAHNQVVKERIGDRAQAALAGLTRLTGARSPRTAPALGAARPAGSVPLAALCPPPRGRMAR